MSKCLTPKRNWKESDALYDENLERLAEAIKNRQDNDDDSIILAVGDTGTGKSTIMLHLGELIAGENFTIDNIGIDKPSFSAALVHTKEQDCDYKACLNDEADISKRAAITKYNRMILSLYFAIRGENIGHLWCNPSLDMLDKPFIEERISGIIHVVTKSRNAPRIYYYYHKDQIIQILEKYKNLKLKTLYKVRKKYAKFRGWFRDYDGLLKKEYLEKKKQRMSAVIDGFYDEFGEKDQVKTYKIMELARKFDKKDSTIVNNIDKKLILDEDYYKEGSGRRIVYESGLQKLEDYFYGRRKTIKR